MKQRKRAPGAGRKPKGAVAARLVALRMPDDVYSQLEAAVERHPSPRRTLTDEIVGRLRNSFSRERDERRDPAMRGLCYLIAELAHHVVGIYTTRGISRIELYDWRADPFFYRAFKTAVVQLLDALEPTGPIKAHEIIVDKKIDLDAHMKRFYESFAKPESRAKDAINFILTALRAAPHLSEEQIRDMAATDSAWAYSFYGIADAARDLAIKRRSGETTTVKFNLQLSLSGEPASVTWSVPVEELKRIEALEKGG